MRKDLKLHALAGFVAGALASPSTARTLHVIAGYPVWLAAVFGVFVGWLFATVVGWGKEDFYDAARPENHTRDPKDAHYTAKGGLVGAIVGAVVWGLFNV